MGNLNILPKYYRCYKCGHKWLGRLLTPPAVCPKCHNYNWQKYKSSKQNES